MNSTYRAIQIQLYFVLVVLLVAGYFTLRFSKEIIAAKNNVRSHNQLLTLVMQARANPNSKQISLELQKTRAYTKNPDRATHISNFIQAYNSNNKLVFDRRYNELISFEKTFLQISEDSIETNSNNIFAIIFGAIILHILNIFVYLRIMQKQMLQPITHLTQKINDFISGSYSYRFSTSPDNEIGNLERSFRLMAEEVLKNMEELKTLDKAKSEFMNIVSHELRTPMTSIKGSLGLISSGKMGELPEKVKKLIEIAEVESNRLIRLINDFLDLAKIEARSYSLQKKWVNIQQIILSSVESLKGLQEKAKVKIEIMEVANVEANVEADKIQQVMVNLLSNAMKFTPENGVVRVYSQVFDNHLLVRIKDQGPGISEEHQAQIFQKFRQASTPDRPLVKGTGLGLSIAKALIEAHEGKIGVNSKLGEGSEFYFVLSEFRDVLPSKELQAA